MSYYDDEDDVDIRVSSHHRSPPSPVHYVEARPRRAYDDGPVYLRPAGSDRMVVTTRSRSRERRSTASSSAPSIPQPPPPPPVIIKNIVNNDLSSDDDDDRHMQVALAHHRSHSRGRRDSSSYMTREDYELERARQELRELRLLQDREKEERRHAREIREEAELANAKKELDSIKQKERDRDEEHRIKSKIELERLREEEKAEEEKRRRDKEAKLAVERYKQEETERQAKEKREAEERDREYKHRLQEDLIKSGLDEKAIQAILNKEKLPEKKPGGGGSNNSGTRPTYTRMARRYISIETLRTYQIEYDIDVVSEFSSFIYPIASYKFEY